MMYPPLSFCFLFLISFLFLFFLIALFFVSYRYYISHREEMCMQTGVFFSSSFLNFISLSMQLYFLLPFMKLL